MSWGSSNQVVAMRTQASLYTTRLSHFDTFTDFVLIVYKHHIIESPILLILEQRPPLHVSCLHKIPQIL